MPDIVNPNLYDHDYYLSNNLGFEEFLKGIDKSDVHHKYQYILDQCNFKTPDISILDIGCGRGELVYYSAVAGANALGIDYSSAAIEIANSYKNKLNKELKDKITFLNIDALDLSIDKKHNYIFMIEVWEHMYDHQIIPLLKKVHTLLKENGTLIITTPNRYYEKILYPSKKIIETPFNISKFTFRVLKNKWKPKSFKDFLKHTFKIKPFRNKFMDKTHVNISSPLKIKKMLIDNNFEVKIKCKDHSKNILSLIFSHWAGRDMLITATKRMN